MNRKLWKKALSALTAALMAVSAVPLNLFPRPADDTLTTAAAGDENYTQVGSETAGYTQQGFPVQG